MLLRRECGVPLAYGSIDALILAGNNSLSSEYGRGVSQGPTLLVTCRR